MDLYKLDTFKKQSDLDIRENDEDYQILNERIQKSIFLLHSNDIDVFLSSFKDICEMIYGYQDSNFMKSDELILHYLVDVINFNLMNSNCIKMDVLSFLKEYLMKKLNFEENLPYFDTFQKLILKLFEFETESNEFKDNINSIIIDCFGEIIRLIPDNNHFINIIRNCLNGEIQINLLTQMKLIMDLSNHQLLSFFEDKIINSFIINSVEFYIFEENGEQNIFWEYLIKIYKNCPNLINYLQDEHIKKIVRFSNNYDYDFDIWELIKILMLEFENSNYLKLFIIAQHIDFDAYLLLFDSDNYVKVGSIIDIFSILINNFPTFLGELSINLWKKIALIYHQLPTKIKSKAINCLSYLLNPILKLPDEMILDKNIIEIISSHLQIQKFEDLVNLLFILQILIFISIKIDQKKHLRELFMEFNLIDYIEEISNDFGNELNDDSIDNILCFFNDEAS